ncbi:MAG TPA: PspC domain-containing protein [Bacteroidales bacterium]|nr:PspC domain-containing protein [Bacteroidales bacterium]HPS61972.1 PspC domain-containing protein [Bacteroidales bacterium]
MEPKRLYRSVTDRKFAGVAGGLAEYFVMDPLLVRLVFVILTLAGGGGVLIYLVLWIVTPENPVRVIPNADAAQAPSDPAPQDPENPAGSWTQPSSSNENPAQPVPPVKGRERTKGSLVGGLVLITLGGLFLADELIPRVNFGDLWPVLLIVIGIGLLINAITRRNRTQNSL